jgi:hypothetical protein
LISSAENSEKAAEVAVMGSGARLTIRLVGITDLLEAKELIAEYAAECSIPAIGEISPQAGMYEVLEHSGAFRCFGAFDGDRLVGFATVITTVFPHYGKMVATVESLFVASESRKGIAGTELLEAIDAYAEGTGCVAIVYSAPTGSRLEKLLSGKKRFSRTNEIFCRSLQTNALAVPPLAALPPTAPHLIEKIASAQNKCLEYEQLPIKTDHVIHAGMYLRTITMPPGTALIGTLIKRPTAVITVGSAKVLVGQDWVDVDGYRVLPASANRKQVFVSCGPFIVTMAFPTSAKTVEEAEADFTDEIEDLLSRKQEAMNTVTITGE